MESYSYNGSYTQSGLLRNGWMFDTFEGYFYLDSDNKIKGIESDKINKGKLFGYKTMKKVKMGVGRILMGIIKRDDYNTILELFEELTIAYGLRIKKVINITE